MRDSGKTLIIFPGALGDFVCFLPALQRLAGEAQAELLARAEYGDLLPSNVVTRSLECYEISRLFVSGGEGEKRLKKFFASYQAVFSWMGSGQPDFVTRLSALCQGKSRVFPFYPPEPGRHIADYYLSCLDKDCDSVQKPLAAISLKSEALDWCGELWKQLGLERRKILALAPGSGAREKNWPADGYKAVIEWWEKAVGGKCIVVLGPVEEARGQINDFSASGIPMRNLKLAQLAALLSRCDLYLGNDGGVSHLAAALGAETVALFGPTDPARWRPRGRSVTVMTLNVECSPCSSEIMKSCSHRKCLTSLRPGDVIETLEQLLAGTTAFEVEFSGELPDYGEARKSVDRQQTIR
ncbi:MAG: glycosyltransferase family 9 protein [Deltaproteobacteria bacterium]|nr:glycosyltransferase family 9 protein [Deltaproteobacteria bacterium]